MCLTRSVFVMNFKCCDEFCHFGHHHIFPINLEKLKSQQKQYHRKKFMIVAIKQYSVQVLFVSSIMEKLNRKWNVSKTVEPLCIFVTATDTGIFRVKAALL